MTTRFSNRVQLAALSLLLCETAVLQAEDYTYTTNNGAITITGYRGSGGAVVIPSIINGLLVIAIGQNAFSPFWGPLVANVVIPILSLPLSRRRLEDATA
jgi:hypothetical protein